MKRWIVATLWFLPIFLAVTACRRQSTPPLLAFVSDRNGNKDIYVMNIDGSGLVQLTDSPADDSFPAWSPDGKRIAFVSNRNYRDGNGYSLFETDIYIMDVDGSNLVQLTNDPSFNTTPTWSSDGHRIAFVSNRDGKIPSIYVIDIDGSNLKQLTSRTYDVNPAWSPDGQHIVFSSNRGYNVSGGSGFDDFDIYIMNSDGSNVVRLTRIPGTETTPVWSPDGSRIAFISDPKGLGDQDFDLYVMNADGSNVIKLTSEQLIYSHVTWSPDGLSIVFDKETFKHSGKSNIYIIDADGSNEILLTSSQ